MWNKIQTVAESIIALCAIATLGYSVHQNGEISKFLLEASNNLKIVTTSSKSLEKAINDYTTPLVKFKTYQWRKSSTELSCENPAIGININYYNSSSIPIVVEDNGIQISVGNRSLLPTKIDISTKGPGIIPPGEEGSITMVSPDQFKKEYVKKTPIHLNLL